MAPGSSACGPEAAPQALARATGPSEQTAAQRFLEIHHLRSSVFVQLPKSDLAVWMRVGRDVAEDAAKELYRDMALRHLVYSADGSRAQRGHLHHVRIIAICGPDTRHRSWGPLGQNLFACGYSTCIDGYHPPTVGRIVSLLVVECTKLRKITFGPPYLPFGHEFWEVHILSRSPDSPARFTAHIDHCRNARLYLSKLPQKEILPLPTPSDNYTISCRLDLDMIAPEGYPYRRNAAAWMAALAEAPYFGDLYQAVELGRLPVTIDDLIRLYQRQIDKGYKARLAVMIANRAPAWRPEDLRRLGEVCGATLTTLKLANKYSPYRSGCAFPELPELVSIIRRYLPNLHTFHFSLRGIEQAEAACRSLETPRNIGQAQIHDLRIYTADCETTIFHLARSLIDVCTGSVLFHVGPDDHDHLLSVSWGSYAQTHLVQYLRGLTPAQRENLVDIHLSDLDVEEVHDLVDLEFRPDGSAIPRWASKATAWADDAHFNKTVITNRLLPEVSARADDVGEVSARLSHLMCTKASIPELVDEAEALLETVRAAKAAVDDIQSWLSVVPEREVANLIKTLKARMGKIEAEEEGGGREGP